jgi:hypothetical protein
MRDGQGVAHQAAIACQKVCAEVAHIDDGVLRDALIREGVKVWLSEMLPDELEQIASMEQSKLREYVAQHALDDIIGCHDTHPDGRVDEDGL